MVSNQLLHKVYKYSAKANTKSEQQKRIRWPICKLKQKFKCQCKRVDSLIVKIFFEIYWKATGNMFNRDIGAIVKTLDR